MALPNTCVAGSRAIHGEFAEHFDEMPALVQPTPSLAEWEGIMSLSSEMSRDLHLISILGPVYKRQLSLFHDTCQSNIELERENAHLKARFCVFPGRIAAQTPMSSPAGPGDDRAGSLPSGDFPKTDHRIWPAPCPNLRQVAILPSLQPPAVAPCAEAVVTCSEVAARLPEEQLAPLPPGVTTLLLQNFPGRFKQEDILELLPVAEHGYDFLHMPFQISAKRPSGYAFVNFPTTEAADVFRRRWGGKCLRNGNRTRPLYIRIARIQGLTDNLLNLRMSGIEEVRNERLLPAIFSCGARADFRAALAHVAPAVGARAPAVGARLPAGSARVPADGARGAPADGTGVQCAQAGQL